jgi:osmoprotectant transport system permease protein
MDKDSRGKAGFLGAALFAASVLFLPFIRFRPNRILTGESFRLLGIEPGGPAVLAVLLIQAALFVFLHVRRIPWRMLPALSASLSSLFALAWCSSLPAFAGETTRISIGSGLWAALVAGLLMLWDSGSRAAVRWGSFLVFAVAAGLLLSGIYDKLSIMQEFYNRRETFFSQSARHLMLAFTSTAAAAVLGVLLSFLLLTKKRLERPVFFLVNIAQTIPTLSLLGLLMVPLTFLGSRSELLKSWGVSGVGFWPAWIALFLYAVFPVLNNSLAGLRMTDAAVNDAAKSMGMSRRQVFYKVQLPLAVPLILGGVRTAVTQSMGNAILAALIGGGGLGSFIFLGLAQSASDLVLLGTIPLIALTLTADTLLGLLARLASKGGSNDPGRIAHQTL